MLSTCREPAMTIPSPNLPLTWSYAFSAYCSISLWSSIPVLSINLYHVLVGNLLSHRPIWKSGSRHELPALLAPQVPDEDHPAPWSPVHQAWNSPTRRKGLRPMGLLALELLDPLPRCPYICHWDLKRSQSVFLTSRDRRSKALQEGSPVGM